MQNVISNIMDMRSTAVSLQGYKKHVIGWIRTRQIDNVVSYKEIILVSGKKKLTINTNRSSRKQNLTADLKKKTQKLSRTNPQQILHEASKGTELKRSLEAEIERRGKLQSKTIQQQIR